MEKTISRQTELFIEALEDVRKASDKYLEGMTIIYGEDSGLVDFKPFDTLKDFIKLALGNSIEVNLGDYNKNEI